MNPTQQAPIQAPDPLFDEQQASDYLGGVSVRTLQRWRQEGGGPQFTKLGRLVRYRRSALDDYAAGRVRSSTAA